MEEKVEKHLYGLTVVRTHYSEVLRMLNPLAWSGVNMVYVSNLEGRKKIYEDICRLLTDFKNLLEDGYEMEEEMKERGMKRLYGLTVIKTPYWNTLGILSCLRKLAEEISLKSDYGERSRTHEIFHDFLTTLGYLLEDGCMVEVG